MRAGSFRLVSAVSLGALLMATGALAQPQPKPFATGNATAGKVLSDKDCIACHARLFEGNANRMYTRADRKVRTPEQLLTQVQFCNTQLGTSYFPDEEEHLAAYLNLHYYKFTP